MKKLLLVVMMFALLANYSFGQVAKGDRVLAWQVDMAEDGNYDLAFANAQNACMESAHLFTTWSSVEPTHGNYDASFIASFFDVINVYYPINGVDVELQLAPVNTSALELPSDLLGLSFDDPIVINQFKTLLDTVFAHIPNVTLSALNIGNESDIFFGVDAAEYSAYKTFLDSVVPYAQQLYFNLHGSNLNVGTTITFHGLTDAIQGPLCANLNTGLDIVATTYYPLNSDFTMKSPTVVSTDFATLVAAYPSTAQPIYFVECGYSSSASCNSSEVLQAQFYQEVFDAWDTHYDNIKYLTIFKTNDWSQAEVDQFAIYYGISSLEFKEYLRTLGVRNWNGVGTKKLAYDQILCEVADRNWCSASCPNIGISEEEVKDYLTCFPNPANDKIHVIGNLITLQSMEIINILGISYSDKVKKETINEDEFLLDISKLPEGMYILQSESTSLVFHKIF
ncbi:MAG: T9SS type A sorting domain-containing protein [Crocinitomicaceae bacterium]